MFKAVQVPNCAHWYKANSTDLQDLSCFSIRTRICQIMLACRTYSLSFHLPSAWRMWFGWLSLFVFQYELNFYCISYTSNYPATAPLFSITEQFSGFLNSYSPILSFSQQQQKKKQKINVTYE